ncbi:MAG: YraN family protein [bacterium]|nr:YraN family protein [bacterium]
MEHQNNLHNIETGKLGEDLATNFLVENGYEIIEKNYVATKVEIDIICKINKLWVFVEVKCRNNALVQPEMAVGFAKQKNIARAASSFLYQNKIVEPIRFDIIAINFLNGKVDIAHFEDAFYPVFYK